jgi:hypothetical protein
MEDQPGLNHPLSHGPLVVDANLQKAFCECKNFGKGVGLVALASSG